MILFIGDIYLYKFVRQLLDKKTAMQTIVLVVTSEHLNNYLLRTSANAIEVSMMCIALYYYANIQPKIFNTNLMKLTLAVTISFLIRSSSLTMYALLALIVIILDPNFILPIIVAGLTLTVPLLIFNVTMDSYMYGYGTWEIPQWNFIYWNVV